MSVTTPVPIDAMRRISELLRSGSFRAAHDELETIVGAYPDFGEALRLLAGAKQVLGDPAAAEGLLRRALDLDRNWTPTLTSLGDLLLASGRGGEGGPLLLRGAARPAAPLLWGGPPGPPPTRRAALLLARYYNDTGHPAQALAVAAPLCLSGKADP